MIETDRGKFLDELERDGVLDRESVRISPLEGGVSSDIYLIEGPTGRFVVKRALSKLKVKADWFADLSRNRFEQAYIEYVGKRFPECVPGLLQRNPRAGYFCMEYLEGFTNWKEELLSGRICPSVATFAGRELGRIHAVSWSDPEVEREFDAIENFDQLRIDPYLRATAEQHVDLRTIILAEADRLREARFCLVHGDYSPKNLMYLDDRLVILDCEVACYADPAFDLAFLLNHLMLKGLYHAPAGGPFRDLFKEALTAYETALPVHASSVESRAKVLLPMLLLARVDGKSPVEYLDAAKQELVRHFARDHIRVPPSDLDELAERWFNSL